MSLHIAASQGEIASTVLLPGDPLRARHTAHQLLQEPFCYNEIRAMYGYTGLFNGKRVSIQGTGMGMPSLTIYVEELIKSYGVKQLIRVGTCGAIRPELNVGQVILVTSASGDSGMNRYYFNDMNFAATSNFQLLKSAYDHAQHMGISTIEGPVFSTDSFYEDYDNRWDIWAQHGILAVEMESQMLLTLAARYGVKALSILTVSDNVVTGKSSSPEERERTYMDMMRVGFSLAGE